MENFKVYNFLRFINLWEEMPNAARRRGFKKLAHAVFLYHNSHVERRGENWEVVGVSSNATIQEF
jgi:hypothetical protein